MIIHKELLSLPRSKAKQNENIISSFKIHENKIIIPFLVHVIIFIIITLTS